MIKTIIITNDPGIAADIVVAGVTRVMVDLETGGKKERQKSRSTFISSHLKEDIIRVSATKSNGIKSSTTFGTITRTTQKPQTMGIYLNQQPNHALS